MPCSFCNTIIKNDTVKRERYLLDYYYIIHIQLVSHEAFVISENSCLRENSCSREHSCSRENSCLSEGWILIHSRRQICAGAGPTVVRGPAVPNCFSDSGSILNCDRIDKTTLFICTLTESGSVIKEVPQSPPIVLSFFIDFQLQQSYI